MKIIVTPRKYLGVGEDILKLIVFSPSFEKCNTSTNAAYYFLRESINPAIKQKSKSPPIMYPIAGQNIALNQSIIEAISVIAMTSHT